MGVALSEGCHVLSPWKAYFVEFYGRGMGFWLFAFYDMVTPSWLCHASFQGAKLKLRSRAFCWCIIWVYISTGSFQILSKNILRNLHLTFDCTGWISHIWKKVQANILREPLVLLKQTMPQQKALDLSFNLAPWKWAWQYQEGVTMS